MKPAVFFAALLALLPPVAAAQEGGYGKEPALPEPYATKPVKKISRVTGWAEGAAPQAPSGFTVTRFATLDYPRWLHVMPNGDVLVSGDKSGRRPSDDPHRITLLCDADGDGKAEVKSVLLEDLNQPFGIAFAHDMLYVGTTNAVLRYPYRPGDLKIAAAPGKIADLPAGGDNRHWTRNLLFAPDGSKLYVAVGSSSNVGEKGMEVERRRAAILEMNPDGSGERIFAAGLRNPVGMDWEPATGRLWAAVNERDNLGDELVPDYMTAVVDGGFYGWPWFYFGNNPDPRWQGKAPEATAQLIIPDYALGSHTASLGLAFYKAAAFPEKYRGGAFVGQHGSWNRSEFAGYKVVFIPFKNGAPAGPPQDFLIGFLKGHGSSDAFGRPAGVAVAQDGALLVADDAGNAVWKVSYGNP
jgi:glucose/arabinose dehydrogenase